VSVAADSMMEPKLGMMVGDISFSESKGNEEKKETKKNYKAFANGINEARNKSKCEAKGICFYCKENGHWVRNFPKYLTIKQLGNSFLFC